ncbi:hypothetical protein GEMRC1_007112 [Eukaryota sp. GEM-RC1]
MENFGVISVDGLLEFDSSSTLILNGGSIKAEVVIIRELASITGYGLFNSTIVNYGKIIPSGLLEIQKDLVVAEHSSVLLNYNNNTQLIVKGILSVNGSFVFTFPNSISANYTFSLVLFGSLLSEHDSFKVQCDLVVTTQDYPGIDPVSGQCLLPVVNPTNLDLPPNNSYDILWSRNDIWVPSPPNENSTVIIDGNYINQVVFIDQNVIINSLYLTNVVISLDCSSITVNGFISFIDSSIESTCDTPSKFTSFSYEFIGVTKLSGINLIVLEFGKLIEPQLNLVNSKVIVKEAAALIVDQSNTIQPNISGNEYSVIQIEGLFETRNTLPLLLDTDVSISSTGTLLSFFSGLKVGKSMENFGVISVDGLLQFDSSSTLFLNGGSIKAEVVIIQELASITGYGLIDSTIVNYGKLIHSGLLKIQKDLVVAEHSSVLLNYNHSETQLIVKGILSVNGSFVFAFDKSIPSNYTISLVLFGSLLSEHGSFKVQCDQYFDLFLYDSSISVVTTQDYPGIDPVSGQCPLPLDPNVYLVVPLNNSNDILWSRIDIWVPSPPNENSTVIIDGNYINQVVFIDQNVNINSLYLSNVVLSLDCSSITVNGFTSFIDSSIESTCDTPSKFTSLTYDFIGVTKLSGINLIVLEFGKLTEPQLNLVNSKVIVKEDATLIVDQSNIIQSNISGNEYSVVQIEGLFETRNTLPLVLDTDVSISSTGTLLSFSVALNVNGLLEFDSSSTLNLNGGSIKAEVVIIQELASITGYGLFNSTIVNYGKLIHSGLLKIQKDLVVAEHSSVLLNYNHSETQLIVKGILSVNGSFVFSFDKSIPSNYTISLVLFGSLLSEHGSFSVQCDHVVTTQDYPGIDPVSGQCPLPLDPNVYLVVPLNNSNDILWSRIDIWVPSPPNENSTVIIDGNYINQVVFIDQNVIIKSLYLTNVVLSLQCSSITVNGFTSFIDSSIESTCDTPSEFTSLTYDFIGVTKLSGINLIVLEFGKLIEPQLNLVNSTVIVKEDATLIVAQSDIIQPNISGNEYSVIQIEGLFETRDTLPLVLDTDISISSTGTLLSFSVV